MQPDIPWNVAGIPPEAREAARAAARREGLSVGEWLTRRILKSLTEGGDMNIWRSAADDHRSADEYRSSRETEEMLARVTRSENETQSASRRGEEQLRSLARRLEAAERAQSENSRVVTQTATEINIAAREQAQAFDQLGSHVHGLGDRLARIERDSSHDGVKNAVKGLHDGLSRLADQIADTTRHSASQMEKLAGNVEALAIRLGEARSETDNVMRALSARIGTLEEQLRAAEARAGQQGQAGLERQSHIIAQLGESVDKLAQRITTSEAQTAGAMARLEDQISHVEARQGDAPFDRRLQGIEHTLGDLAERLDGTERSAAGASRTVEESLRTFAARLDATDKRHRDALTDLHATPQPAAPASATPMHEFDPPPFPDAPFQQAAPFAASPEPPPFHAQTAFAGDTPFGTDPFGANPLQPQPGETTDSYIAAARRSARAAATTDIRQAPAAFTWGAAVAPAQEQPRKGGGPRFLLVAGIVVIACGAVVAGIMLSRGLVRNQANTPQPSARALHGTPPVAVSPRADNPGPAASQSGPATAPGSPVVHLRHAPAKVERVDVKAAPVHPIATGPVQTATATRPKPLSPLERLTTLAASGSARAELLLGLDYLDGNGAPVNEAEAAKWLERAARQGEAIAAYRLGTLYERGHGVPADPVKATQWYGAAAKLGNRKAMHNLAVAYAQGSGTQKDMTEAAQWFSKAAALGLADSQFNLAVLYERGMGVQQSLIDAYKWYAIAAAQGDSESKTRLEVIATQLSPDERAAAQKAVAEFHPLPLDRNANIPPDPATLG